jgi:hypothetical protein
LPLLLSGKKTWDNNLFSGGCIFIDHAPHFIDIQFQAHLNTHDTLVALGEFRSCANIMVLFCNPFSPTIDPPSPPVVFKNTWPPSAKEFDFPG